MAAVTIVYWRDIPAQVIVGAGRRAAKVALAERFEQAIDRCAMRIGASDADAYLSEWRKASGAPLGGELDGADDMTIAKAVAAELEAKFDTDKIKALIANDGWEA